MDKKKFLNNSLWWLDFSILNTNNIKFRYFYTNNIFYISLINIFYFILINRKNLTVLSFYTLDSVLKKNKDFNINYLSYQSVFFDFKILLELRFNIKLNSLSNIHSGNSWLERELREFNCINILGLNDSRKLLLNYNYNYNLNYNNYNNIINDINI